MQALFALHVGAEATREVALDKVRKSFEKDLNSMEEQEPELLKAHQKEALTLFKRYLTNQNKIIDKGGLNIGKPNGKKTIPPVKPDENPENIRYNIF